ncbi:hypothetical protein L1887_15718 [Cichorium endivia]|nr:hypothetical protein L1887_15718 [Cichorium endivia]
MKHGMSIGRRVATRKSSKSTAVVQIEEETGASDEDMDDVVMSSPIVPEEEPPQFWGYQEVFFPVIGTPAIVDDKSGTLSLLLIKQP